MFRLPIKVYGAVVTLKKIKSKKQNEKFFSSKICEFFNENPPPTHHIKFKRIDFATCNKLMMANKVF